MQNLLNIYRASAGAGKTFLLTANFLKLAFKNPRYYRKILAVTFTNKAAEEMKSRITEEIHILAENPEKSLHLQALKEELKISETEEIKKRAEQVQDEILHNYSLFSVSTIDKFVQSVIRAFTFEMNLHSNFKLQLDTDTVTEELRSRLYEKLKTDKNITHWLIEFAKYKIEEGKSWNFDTEIAEISQNIFKEEFQERNIQNFSSENLEKLQIELLKRKRNFEQKMRDISLKSRQGFATLPFDYQELGQKVKYIGVYLSEKINNRNFEPSATILKIYDTPDEWANKTAKKETREKISEFANIAAPLLRDAINLYKNEYSIYLSVYEILRNFYSFGLLTDIAALLPEYRSDYNELLISDTTLLLKKLTEDNDTPFIYEKTGNRYNNILIDEFQDTSGFQWHNFKPLILNSLASGFYNLLVGDIKQSIYSWRGGDRKLLMYKVKEQIGTPYISEHNLPYNRRSDKFIVKLNNTLFKRIPKILQAVFNSKFDPKTDGENQENKNLQFMQSAIEEAYKGQMQLIPEYKKNNGYVKLVFFNAKDISPKEELENAIHEKIGEHIEKIISAGHNAGDIALLVRTNAQAKAITNALYQFQKENPEVSNYQVISDSSTEILKAKTIRVLSSAMKILNSQDDILAEKELLLNYLKLKNKLPDDLHEIMQSASDIQKFLPASFFENKDTLKQLSLFELSEYLIEIFELRANKDEFEFLRNFQDLIFNFLQNQGNDLNEFVNWLDGKGHDKSLQINALHNAVQILTIHKSKGLGVPHLIIPYADWNVNPKPKSTFWAKNETNLLSEIEYFPINYKQDIANTIFKNSYYNYTLQTNIEMLNLLYVAMTRPKNSLFMCVPYKPSKEPKSIGDFIHAAVKQTKMSDEDTENYLDTESIYDSVTEVLEKGKIMQKDTKAYGRSNNVFEVYPGNNGKLKPEISYQSKDFFAESISYIEEKINYGSLMHKILAGIKQPEDAPVVLNDLHNQGYITQKEKENLLIELKKLLQRESVAAWFAPGLEVISEKALLNAAGETKIPDRVIKKELEITVIDFKFGKERPEHISQIEEYKNLLQEVYGQKVNGVLYYAAADVKREL